MAESRDEDFLLDRETPGVWPLRPILLALLGLATALWVHWILGPDAAPQPSAIEAAGLVGVIVGAGVISFTVERRLAWAAILFGVVTGAIAAAVIYWNGAPLGWSTGEGWRAVCLLLAVAIAAPLFQAARDEAALRFPYASVHDYAWTNVVLFGVCCVFVAVTFAMAWLLASLFQLIKIDLLRTLLTTEWFYRALIGLAFGGALGILREHDLVVRLAQRVVATVLAVLAPALATGLILFLVALPFTGLDALWDATSAATPILLACVIGALILSNAVIGDVPEHERRFVLLRYGALGLALAVLPLAMLAAIATGLRIGQYGFTPERLWAVVFVGIACVYGVAYLAAVALGRWGWMERARPANLNMAVLICGVALLLASPLISFEAISTRDQVARLESGKIAPDRFDWRALAFDFGRPGRAALTKLASSPDATIRAQAIDAAKAQTRWDIGEPERRAGELKSVEANARVLPEGAILPPELKSVIANEDVCEQSNRCTVLLVGDAEAVVISDSCMLGKSGPVYCARGDRYVLADGKWISAASPERSSVERAATVAGYNAGKLEIRTVPRRQLYVGGQPVGDPFE